MCSCLPAPGAGKKGTPTNWSGGVCARAPSFRTPAGRRTATSDAFPLRLNTGRLRDQWHTMTRSGKSPRLGAHSPEPLVDIHPDDASRTGITDGGFAKVTTPHGGAVFRVCVRSGQQRGSIFAPIHWSYSTAADACVGALAMAENDPFSGHPQLNAPPP